MIASTVVPIIQWQMSLTVGGGTSMGKHTQD
jgi:hypothetical protein